MPAHVSTVKQMFVDRQLGQFANGRESILIDGIAFHAVVIGNAGQLYLAPIINGATRFTGSMAIPFAEAEQFFRAGLNFVQTERAKAEHIATQSEKNK